MAGLLFQSQGALSPCKGDVATASVTKLILEQDVGRERYGIVLSHKEKQPRGKNVAKWRMG